jgi:ribose/xylose/arabinose/galactoside ABC-type transport system permease subunit
MNWKRAVIMNNVNKEKLSVRKIMIKNLLLLVIVVEIAIGYLINPSLLTPSNIQVILFACTLNGLISIGQSLMLIAKEIDLSVGANLVFAPMLAVYTTNIFYNIFTGTGILQGTTGFMTGGWAMVVLLTLVFGALLGLVNGLIVTKLKVPAFVTTIGMAFFMKGMAYVMTSGVPISFQNMEETKFVGNTSLFDVIPISVIIFIIVGLLIIFINSRTKFGMRLYATGGAEKAAKLSGINTGKWKTIIFTLCGFLVGIAAVMSMSRIQGVDITQSAGYDLNSIAISIMGGIAISGGRGSISGTMQATLIVAILLNILSLQGLMAYYQTAITGVVIIILAIIYKRNESKRLKQLKIIEV